jgi:hypothetical protein
VFKDIQQAILSNLCLMRFNHWCLVVIRTDFSSVGFGFIVCQPTTGEASESATLAYPAGKDFTFMSKDTSAALCPVALGGQRCRGYENRLHSHLGKGFAGNWAFNKNRYMLFGTRFVWVTNCYAIHFILSFKGNNPAILCLQMWLMCWDMDIVHRNDIHLTNADYCSCIGEDMCFDPHFKEYLDFNRSLCSRFHAPVGLPMCPENMPYYHRPQVLPPTANAPDTTKLTYCQTLYSSIIDNNREKQGHHSHIPVRFSNFSAVMPSNAHSSINNNFPV